MLENVRAFRTTRNGKDFKEFMTRFTRIRDKRTGEPNAYSIRLMDIISQDQGSPQSRSRLYFVGILKTAMDDPTVEVSAPSSLPFPDIDEFLDPIALAGDPDRYPGAPAANANVDAAFDNPKAGAARSRTHTSSTSRLPWNGVPR